MNTMMVRSVVQLADERGVTESAPAIKALLGAGALLVGKTTCHELGIGMTGVNPATGTPRNPHNPKCATGGAASGCAAVVASGLCAFAIGEVLHWVPPHLFILQIGFN